MSILLLHVHGVGGKDFDEKFILKTKEFLKSYHLENKISTITYKWNSVNIRIFKALQDWNCAIENADNEYENFSSKIFEFGKKYDKIYITAFSLGTRIVANYLNKIDQIPSSIKYVFFMGAAINSNFNFNKELPFKILNYYSDKTDSVLKKLYSFTSQSKAGGQYGFDDLKNFINLSTSINHTSYNKVIPSIILSFIIYMEKSIEINTPKIDISSNFKKVKIKYNSLIMVIEWNNIIIYQNINWLGTCIYYLVNLNEDRNYAYEIPEKTNDLISLLKYLNIDFNSLKKMNIPDNNREIRNINVFKDFSSIKKFEIKNVHSLQKSFQIKLIYKIPIIINTDINKPFFKRFVKTDNSSYLSNLNILTNEEFRTLTDNIFIWEKSKKGLLPLIYLFDFSFFKAKKKIFIKIPGLDENSLVLKNIDLVPIKNKYSYLSFNFEGFTCEINDYLKIISKQNFGKLKFLETGNTEFDDKKVSLSGMISYITESLTFDSVDTSLLKEKTSGERPFIMQYLLFNRKINDFQPDILNNILLSLGAFCKENASNKMPNIWHNKDDTNVMYSTLKNRGITAISTDNVEFYRNEMPNIFLKANYMQYIILEELKERDLVNTLANCFQDEIRKNTLKNLANTIY